MKDDVAVAADGWVVRPALRGRELLGYLGEPPMFAGLHIPHDARRSVLVCSPIYAEFMQNYGREVRLSRALLEAGIASARFHYRGTGDSAGKPDLVTLDSMVDDALAVAARLVEESGAREVDVVGTRLGGHVAAEVARRLGGGSRLVVWEPVPDTARYFDEVFRANRMVGVIAQDDAAVGKQAMEDELRVTGRVDVVGYHIHQSLYDSVIGAAFPNGGLGQVLLVQASRSERIKKAVQGLANQIEAGGGRVEIAVVPPGEGWWIHNYDEDASPDAAQAAVAQLVELTARWLAGGA